MTYGNKPTSYLIVIFTHLKYGLADAIQYFKLVTMIQDLIKWEINYFQILLIDVTF